MRTISHVYDRHKPSFGSCAFARDPMCVKAIDGYLADVLALSRDGTGSTTSCKTSLPRLLANIEDAVAVGDFSRGTFSMASEAKARLRSMAVYNGINARIFR